MCDLMAELIEKLDEQISLPPEPPVVNVEAPVVNVPTQKAPVVNVAPPARGAWTFTVHRNSEGLIETMIATPQ